MDYRLRKYYLVRFWNPNRVISEIKNKVPSIKVHTPYDHYRTDKSKEMLKLKFGRLFDYMSDYIHNLGDDSIYDSDVCKEYVQYMISCRKEESVELESILTNLCTAGPHMTCYYFKEITKEELKQ